MKEKNSQSSKFFNIISFPEKIGVLFLVLCIIIICLIETTIIIFVIPDIDYSYEPEYEEVLYYDHINPYIRSITGYYDDDENDIYSSMTVTFCYFGKDTAHKATNTLGSFTIVDDNDEIYYVGDITRSTSTSYSATCIPLSRLSTTLSGIKRFYGKVEYDKVINGVNEGSDIIYFKEDVISIDDINLNKIEFSNIDEINYVIKNYSVTTTKSETKTTIKNRIDIISNLKEEFHMDYQLFGIDSKGNSYDLIGYYNYNKNYSLLLNHETTVPNNLEFKYYVAVFKIVSENEGTKTIYIKKTIE